MAVYKYMSPDEIVEFIITRLDDNSYFGISETTKEDDYYEGAWWSCACIKYADAKILVFNMYGGGSSYVYDIDDSMPDSDVRYAVRDFVKDVLDIPLDGNHLKVDVSVESIK